VLSNADAIAVNQDALGVQAQRVSSSSPLTATAALAPGAYTQACWMDPGLPTAFCWALGSLVITGAPQP
jgi:hypothetical protein